jgi:hypothetical protein
MLVKRLGDSGKYRYTISGKANYVNHEEKLKKYLKRVSYPARLQTVL